MNNYFKNLIIALAFISLFTPQASLSAMGSQDHSDNEEEETPPSTPVRTPRRRTRPPERSRRASQQRTLTFDEADEFDDEQKELAERNLTDVIKSITLTSAVEAQNESMVHSLLEQGVNLAMVDHTEETVFHKAARTGNMPIMQALLIAEAAINNPENAIPLICWQNGEGETPLMIATQAGHRDVVEELLKYNTPAIKKAELLLPGYSALTYAIQQNNPDIAALLLAQCEVGTERNEYILCNLHLAARPEKRKICKGLIEQVTLTEENTIDLAPLAANLTFALNYAASEKDGTDLIELLTLLECLKGKIGDLNMQHEAMSRAGLQALETAQSVDLENNVVALLKAANKQLFSFSEQTWEKTLRWADSKKDPHVIPTEALHWAARTGNVRMIEHVINGYPVQIDAPDQSNANITPLMGAIQYGHSDAAKFLMHRDASVALLDSNDDHALLHAVRTGNLALVTCVFKFVEQHHDKDDIIFAQNTNEEDALCLALTNNPENDDDTENIALFFIDAARDNRYQLSATYAQYMLSIAALANNAPCVQALSELTFVTADGTHTKLDLDMRDPESGNTPLMEAVLAEKPKSTSTLIRLKADVNACNELMLTPLTFCAQHETDELVTILLEAKADINHQDTDGSTPLMCAAQEQNAIVTHTLLHAKADVHTQNRFGDSALAMALNDGDGDSDLEKSQDTARLLLLAGADPTQKNKDTGESPYSIASENTQKFMKEVQGEKEAAAWGALALTRTQKTRCRPYIGPDAAGLIHEFSAPELSHKQNILLGKRKQKQAGQEHKRQKTDKASTHTISCRTCTLENSVTQDNCRICGTPLNATAPSRHEAANALHDSLE